MNELSVAGQYNDIQSFFDAIDRVMRIRTTARRFGRELYCHRNLANAQVTATQNMYQVIGQLDKDKRGVLLLWLTRKGPFWDEVQVHNQNDYLECNEDIVTDTAIGEAASRVFNGTDCHLVSMIPSNWAYSPIQVYWRKDPGDDSEITVFNHTSVEQIEPVLRLGSDPVTSWAQLSAVCINRFSSLTFSEEAFQYLEGRPFVKSAAMRITERLDTLEKLQCSYDNTGRRTLEGNNLYDEHFTGDKAWFSTSSDDEKVKFRDKLTFRHPEIDGESLFCPWHGKVKTPQFRIHFSSLPRFGSPLYVVYIGPKITKR